MHDDGHGMALFVGGNFSFVGGVAARAVAKHDGVRWHEVGGGIAGIGGSVSALAVYDDGTGAALYAGGSFTTAGGAPIQGLARWNGTSWSSVGAASAFDVKDLLVHDDGNGPALFVAGSVSAAGGFTASRIARWNGSTWSALGGGVTTNNVWSLGVFDDGSGPALYIGGTFSAVSGVPAVGVAKWDGSAWSALGSGVVFSTTPGVGAMKSFDDGSGPRLYVGGNFHTAGGAPALNLAAWDGSNWSTVPGGANGRVNSLEVFDDGTGSALYASGMFTSIAGVPANQVARLGLTGWSAVGAGMPEAPNLETGLALYSDSSGSGLFAGGRTFHVWRATGWTMLGTGLESPAYALATFDDGTGEALVAGGDFVFPGGLAADGIAKWDGSNWSPLGAGLDWNPETLATFDDGQGLALYAGGSFTTAGGIAANHVAKWDGSAWSALGSGMNGLVYELRPFDDGNGPALYATGFFTTAGGVAANFAARWDGTTWSALGGGLGFLGHAIAEYDDGTGPALYFGGFFTSAGGAPANYVARWNGSTWSALGSGVNSTVFALTVFDDGSGPALYAGGAFTTAGGVPAQHIARWNGTQWSSAGSLSFSVQSLHVHDDGTGPALYAGGIESTSIPGRISKWSGSGWTTLGGGLDHRVYALASFDDGSGSALFVGGEFASAGPNGDSHLAKWGCPASTGVAFCFGDGSGAACPCANFGSAGNGCANSVQATGANLSGAGLASLSQDAFVLSGTGMPGSASALYFQGTTQQAGGLGTAFGDGLRCSGGAVVRLKSVINANGESRYPQSGDASVSVRGAIGIPGTRTYQVWYRNAATFCTPSTFNLSNGLSVTWGP